MPGLLFLCCLRLQLRRAPRRPPITLLLQLRRRLALRIGSPRNHSTQRAAGRVTRAVFYGTARTLRIKLVRTASVGTAAAPGTSFSGTLLTFRPISALLQRLFLELSRGSWRKVHRCAVVSRMVPVARWHSPQTGHPFSTGRVRHGRRTGHIARVDRSARRGRSDREMRRHLLRRRRKVVAVEVASTPPITSTAQFRAELRCAFPAVRRALLAGAPLWVRARCARARLRRFRRLPLYRRSVTRVRKSSLLTTTRRPDRVATRQSQRTCIAPATRPRRADRAAVMTALRHLLLRPRAMGRRHPVVMTAIRRQLSRAVAA